MGMTKEPLAVIATFFCSDVRIIISGSEKEPDHGKIQDLMLGPTRCIRIKDKQWLKEDLTLAPWV